MNEGLTSISSSLPRQPHVTHTHLSGGVESLLEMTVLTFQQIMCRSRGQTCQLSALNVWSTAHTEQLHRLLWAKLMKKCERLWKIEESLASVCMYSVECKSHLLTFIHIGVYWCKQHWNYCLYLSNLVLIEFVSSEQTMCMCYSQALQCCLVTNLRITS